MTISPYSSCKLPTPLGVFDFSAYRNQEDVEILVISMGDLTSKEAPFVRIHSQCFTGEVLGSLKCDCKDQLFYALKTISKEKNGLIIYLSQEGRGIGLGNKIKAYALQETGLDTVEANHVLGFAADLRDFQMAAELLKYLKVKKIRLNTNNPDKVQALVENGIVIEKIIRAVCTPNEHNREYLKTKYHKMGHDSLGVLFQSTPQEEEIIGD